MKRTAELLRAGVPSAGLKIGRFLGWRRPHWHDIRIVEGYDANDFPIVRYEPPKQFYKKGARP